MAKQTATQNALILHHLQSGSTLTGLQALKRFKCLRLSARILDLKQDGHPIEARFVTIRGKRVSEYFIAQ